MILILLIALAIYFLIQITTWTLSSFRSGIVVFSFSTPISESVPKNLINRMVEIKGMMFKFVTKDIGLFKIEHGFVERRWGFPFLGEIRLTETGVAQIKIRVPLSFVLLATASFIGLVSFFMQGVYTIDAISQGFVEASAMIAFIGVFILLGILVEKNRINYGMDHMKKYLEQQNRNPDN